MSDDKKPLRGSPEDWPMDDSLRAVWAETLGLSNRIFELEGFCQECCAFVRTFHRPKLFAWPAYLENNVCPMTGHFTYCSKSNTKDEGT